MLKIATVSIAQAQPSPTTGKFSFVTNGNSKNSTVVSESVDKGKDNFFEDFNASSFAFKPVPDSGSSFFLGATSKVSTYLPFDSMAGIMISKKHLNRQILVTILFLKNYFSFKFFS